MANTESMSGARKAEIGAGIAAGVAAAALGAYFLYGSKDAKKNRAKVKGWMLKARGEVLEQLETMEQVTESSYDAVVKNVLQNYRGLRNVSAAELVALASDLRRHWKTLKPMFKAGKSTGRAKGGRTRSSKGGKGRKRAPRRSSSKR
jgi:hypothetical protein